MFSPIASHNSNFHNDTNVRSRFSLAELQNEAWNFAQGNTEIYEFINLLLQEKEFQRDPREYLDKWSERRGTSRITRYPEDYARPFFDMYFPQKRENSCIIL